MKNLLLYLTLFICFIGSAQKRHNAFDTLKVDSSSKLLLYSNTSMELTNKYSFILKDSAIIREFLSNLRYGDRCPNVIYNSATLLDMMLVIGGKCQFRASIDVGAGAVLLDCSYQFDRRQLIKYSRSYGPLQLTTKMMRFETKNDYNGYFKNQLLNPDFLYCVPPDFSFEGEFVVKVSRTAQVSDTKSAMDYLKTYVEKIVGSNDYRMMFVLDMHQQIVGHQPDSISICFQAPEKLYKQLSVPGCAKGEWNANWAPTGGFVYQY